MSLALHKECNITLETLRINDSELPIILNLTFHDIALIIAASNSLIAISISFFLIFMHATHYSKPNEQRHIIRILFMVPIYSAGAFLSLVFYWHAIYFQFLSDCYEAITIASFFALLCHYIAPNLHDQKTYFRGIKPMEWVWPLNWFKFCCAIAWRTPSSGLTWFNIIWTGVYQYCFIRVTMTIVAIITEYYGIYCESSQSPVFAHIWVMVIEGLAVTIAMYCLIQFYVQLRGNLSQHRPFLKILAIKLVIFLSFWQTFMINVLTSTAFNIIKPSPTIGYPDLKIGIPSLLLCTEMAIFSILHLYSFPYQPYTESGQKVSLNSETLDLKNDFYPNQGGLLGMRALFDAMNPWDLVKCFARAVPWLLAGCKKREADRSDDFNDQDDTSALPPVSSRDSSSSLPIADEFRRSKFTTFPRLSYGGGPIFSTSSKSRSQSHYLGYVPAKQRFDIDGNEIKFSYHDSTIGRAVSDLNQDTYEGHASREPSTPELKIPLV
ncbi:Transmembrane protein 184C [Golovinomyces cichoracearum]|uniref:Transmembrane protein 184C n=1 Tax=Golovinomyces cichoracearum TaxID=62708 RepID=A0A420IS32_9PEZI|nr:Transmembrane protein 184C [Golovinomyces cichoracearum]